MDHVDGFGARAEGRVPLSSGHGRSLATWARRSGQRCTQSVFTSRSVAALCLESGNSMQAGWPALGLAGHCGSLRLHSARNRGVSVTYGHIIFLSSASASKFRARQPGTGEMQLTTDGLMALAVVHWLGGFSTSLPPRWRRRHVLGISFEMDSPFTWITVGSSIDIRKPACSINT